MKKSSENIGNYGSRQSAAQMMMHGDIMQITRSRDPGGVSLIQILESPEDWLCRRTRLRFEVLGLHIYGNISKDAASCRYLFGGFSWKIKKKTDWLFPGSRIILKLGIFQGHFLLSFLRHRSSKVSGNLLWKKLRLIVYVSLIIIIINCGIFFWGILIFLNILRALNMLI